MIERTAFLAAAAAVLLAALVASPAAARDIASGSTIFVGEENLNLTAISGNPVATLVYYNTIASGGSGTIGRTISVGNSNAFELNATDVGTSTGAWYTFPVGSSSLTDPGAAEGYVLVQVPATLLDVKLAGTTGSVNGKTVTRSNNIVFVIQHNLGSRTPAAFTSIEVTTPSGGTLNVFGSNSVDLRDIVLTGQSWLSPAVDLTDVEGGTYTARVVWPDTSDFYGKGYDSNTVAFEIVVRMLGITANKESVIRNNNFVVTITGESGTTYSLYVRDIGGLAPGQYPAIPPGQPGVSLVSNALAGSPTRANVTTNAAGSRSVQFNTNQSTGEWRFTIRVEDPTDATIYDDVRVRVERGAMTIVASGTGVYYLGEEIFLSGTNTDSDVTYLFLTGPNLGTRGVKLNDLRTNVVNGSANTFTTQAVETDDTWTYRWDTSCLNRLLDDGGYTIYAVSEPRSKDVLDGVPFSTASVQLRSPSVTVTASSAAVAKGDDLTISGTATGDPANVCIWVFGRDYSRYQQPLIVESDATFDYTIESDDTRVMRSGQCFVVVQHPMMNDVLDVWVSGTTLMGNGITPVDLATLQQSEAANALIAALDSPYIDDIYANLTFAVEEPWIHIDPLGDLATGSVFTISGTTNLAVGDKINIEVTSSSFQPTSKNETTGFGAASGVATVLKGDGANTWSMNVDTTGFEPDEYIVRVESVKTETFQSATFNVTEGDPTPPPGENLPLAPGWNFVSVPRPLAAGNDNATIFAAVDTDGRSVFRYDTAGGQWIALTAADRLAPLEGFWIYSAGPAAVPLNFSTVLPVPPAERNLATGWNAVGVTGTDPATARDTLYSVNGQWTTLIGFDAGTQAFETAVVNGGSGAYADDRQVYPERGYWLYMTGPGTLCAVGA